MLLASVIIFIISVGDIDSKTPPECCSGNYKLLKESERLFSSTTMASVNDLTLTEGWYRFNVNGKQMKENFPDLSTMLKLKETFHPCGARIIEDATLYKTSNIYSLKQVHPKQKDGLVKNNIQGCRYEAVMSSCNTTTVNAITQSRCNWLLKCDIELETVVRNCGHFFLYYLRPLENDGVYCSDETKTDTEVSPRLECQQYVNVTDSTRQWNATETLGLLVQRNCQDPLFTKQWTRFLINNQSQIIDTPIAEGCRSKLDDSASNVVNNPPCGALYRGWINGKHPTEKGVLTKKTICFSHPTTCECQASAEISIINCGAFNIYKRREFPLCEARACTVLNNADNDDHEHYEKKKRRRNKGKKYDSNNLCRKANKIKDDTRYWSSIKPTVAKCDANYNEAVRYVTSRGKNLKLREGCSSNIPLLPVGKCESTGASWLDGTHPRASMGVVPRFVCVHTLPKQINGTYDFCECSNRKLILVQNCGRYFAYQLDPIKDCLGRYCVAGTKKITKERQGYGKKIQPTCSDPNEIPYECRPENYNFLNEEGRLFLNNINPFFNNFNDFRLQEGWYRFNVTGQQLFEGPLPDYSNTPITTSLFQQFSRCGSSVGGINANGIEFGITSELNVLKQPHPKVADGLVKRDIQTCHYKTLSPSFFGPPPTVPGFKICTISFATNELTCYWNLICSNAVQQTYVRNCGDFYVYNLGPSNRPVIGTGNFKSATYCSDKTRTDPEVLPRLECRNYVNLTDSSRLWDATDKNVADIVDECQDRSFTKYWTRLFANGTAGVYDTAIPVNCPSISNNDGSFMDTPLCGAFYRGWLHGQYPNMEDGLVQRKLCFSHPTTCECQASSDISIINCGEFYIYKRNQFPLCEARACTLPKAEAISSQTHLQSTQPLDLCSNYKTVVDDTRFWSSIDPSSELCDGGFKKPVRFMSSRRENLKLKEGCNSSELLFPIGKCQSRTVTWLNGEHPSDTTKPVPASVCLHTPGYPSFGTYQPCSCPVKQKILIQKCVGDFFVYKLDGFENCKSRYCLEEPQCKNGYWRLNNACTKDGKKVRICYQRDTMPSKYNGYYYRPYIATDIKETVSTTCLFNCKLSGKFVFGGENIKRISRNQGIAILPFNTAITTGTISGEFKSLNFTKGSQNQVFCFNYGLHSGSGNVELSVSIQNVNSGMISVIFNTSVTLTRKQRDCFMIPTTIPVGDTFQVIFKAISNYNTHANIKSYSIQNRDAIPIQVGTNFTTLESVCTANNNYSQCFLEKQQQPNSKVDWVWNSNGYMQLVSTARRINGDEVTLTTKDTINTEKQSYCLKIQATGSLKSRKYSSYYQRFPISITVYMVFTDGTVKKISRFFLKKRENLRQYRIPSVQGCFKIQIRVFASRWGGKSFLYLHNVSLRDEECQQYHR